MEALLKFCEGLADIELEELHLSESHSVQGGLMPIQSIDDLKTFAMQCNLAILPGFANWVSEQRKLGKSFKEIAQTIELVAQRLAQ